MKMKGTKRPIHAVTTWVRRQPPKMKAFLALVSGLTALLFLRMVVHDHDNLFVAAEAVHALGISLLIFKLSKDKTCSGLSLKSQELTALFLAVRLYCSFVMEYDIHTLLDLATLGTTLWVIYMIRFKLKASYMDDKDNLAIYYVCEPQTPFSNEKEILIGKGKHNPLKRRRMKKKQPASSPSSGLKSKKEKVRSLSAVAKALSTFQMVTQKQQHASPSSHNTFNLPIKFSKHCNGVDHASVPRKIRSAMKKQSRESTLSDSEKVKGIESAEKDGIKKSKKPSWSTSQAGCGAITKDEEEVAETLFSLAGMFPHNASNASKVEPQCQSLPDESANATFEASGTTWDASPCPENSPRGAAKIMSSNETVGQQQNDFPESAKFLMQSHSIDQTQPTPMLVKSENGSKFALLDSELCLAMGLNVPRQSLNSQIGKQPDMEFEKVGIDSKQEQHVIKDLKENEGPALRPGLSSRASSGTNAPYLQSSAAKAPDWLNAAICASKHNVMESCSSSGTIPEVVTRRKSWKSCAAHVHISHLIRSLEVSKGQVKKEADVYKLHQMRVQQISKCGVLKEVDNLNGIRSGISSAAGTVHSSTIRNSNEAKNSILQQQCYYHDISQAPPTSRVYGPQNPSFNFLSLSSGGNELKVNDSFNKGGSRLEPSSKYQVPYFQTMQRHHGLMPMPTPQSQYASTSYHDQHPVAGPQARLQQPHYYGSPLNGTHYSSTVSNKQQHQSFWAVQLTAPQGRAAAVNCNIERAQYHNWQSGWHGSSAVSSCAQFIVPHSPEALESKLTSISEQQLLALASSLPPSRTSGLNIHLPSVCEESRGRFHSGGTPSLQLLCD